MARGQLSNEDRLKIKVTRLENINRGYKEKITLLEREIVLLKEEDKRKDTVIQTLLLRLEELEKIIFGKGKKQEKERDQDEPDEPSGKNPKAPRDASSYHRPIPKKEDIAREEYHALSTPLCSCGAPHAKQRTRAFYAEDIILPTTDTPLTEAVKHTVEQGYCPRCRRWTTALPLPSTPVILGERVRAFIAHASVILRISHEQIQKLLYDLYHFNVSSGEITTILEKEATLLAPEHERLKERIREQKAAHYDETSYRVQSAKEARYAWVMTGTENQDTVFAVGKSRGKGEAEKLKGDADHTGITDGYVAYTNLFTEHQLCWSHPDRKIRDLGASLSLDENTKEHCQEVHHQFSTLYKSLRDVLALPFDLEERKKKYQPLSRAFDAVVVAHERDPKKLATIKTSLREQKSCYFVCVFREGIPADNNKAERSIRHLVLKRKISLGCKTDKGARALSVLASVMLSLWWRKPTHFFDEYLALRQPKTFVLRGV